MHIVRIIYITLLMLALLMHIYTGTGSLPIYALLVFVILFTFWFDANNEDRWDA